MKLAELPYSTADLFPAGDFGFQMKFRRGEIAPFYRNRDGSGLVLGERRKWIGERPERYVAALEGTENLLEEAMGVAQSVGVEVSGGGSVFETMRSLGQAWEPDLLILRASLTEQPRLVAGAVCFPSSWALEEKIGRGLDVIHGPVPTLNAQFANPVQQFLARMKPGISWERVNWGLSRSAELNQHPERKLARLDADVTAEEVCFRAEYQSLISLPKSGGVLFGIRLVIEPLTELRDNTEFMEGLARAIRTMPEEIARYKGIAAARGRLLELINGRV